MILIAAAQNGEKVYRIGEEGFTVPKVLSWTHPGYTAEARIAHIEGIVELSVEIDVEGCAENIRVTRSLDPGLDHSAVAAVQQWRFKPGEKNGKPVRVASKITVDFPVEVTPAVTAIE